MAFENINAAPNYFRQSFGQKGFRLITSSFTPVAGEEYRVIVPLDDSTVTAVALAGDNLTAAAVPAGFEVYGLFTSVTVTAGRVLAYIA
jgi:hypothetical protein